MFFTCAAELAQHVQTTHTFPARRGTVAYHKANKKVQQQFQESLPKVQLCGGDLWNKYMKKWVGLSYSADGDETDHVRSRLAMASIEFGRQRSMLRSRRLGRPIKVSGYKGAVLTNVTFGCETITLTPRVIKKYRDFNASCSMVISHRTFTAEKAKPSFDIIQWILWRRARWLGKALRGEKGHLILNAVHWGFQHQQRGDVFHDLPPVMKTTFQVLQRNACDAKF